MHVKLIFTHFIFIKTHCIASKKRSSIQIARLHIVNFPFIMTQAYWATACHRLLIPFMPNLWTRVPLCQGPDMGRSPLPSVAWRPTSRKRPLSSWGSSPEFVWKTTSNNCYLFQQEYLVKQFLPYKDRRHSQASSVPLTPRRSPACSHSPFRVDNIHLLRGTYQGPDLSLLSCVSFSSVYLLHFHHGWKCNVSSLLNHQQIWAIYRRATAYTSKETNTWMNPLSRFLL